MLSYGEVVEVGAKGERLNLWRLSYPGARDGVMGINVLRDIWEFIPATELETMAELQSIIEEIERRESGASATKTKGADSTWLKST